MEKYIIGYIFPQNKILNPGEIAVEKLTHINYAFADIRNGKIIEGFEHDAKNFKILNGLKSKNPGLKILISVGGWTWSGNFSDMTLTKESRQKFIESSIDFMQKHQLDGIDLDWEYPGLPGMGNTHRKKDKKNFTRLLEEFRNSLDTLGKTNQKHYLLTIAAGAFEDYLNHTEMKKAQLYLDFVNIMTYDFTGAWNPKTGHH
ncbi:MAG: glycoside hydrolase, partial [bacterium]